jgi:hypothetical protein
MYVCIENTFWATFSQTHLVTLRTTRREMKLIVNVNRPGLPDGLFPNQKSQFG